MIIVFKNLFLHLELKIKTNKELFRVNYIILSIDSWSIYLRFREHVSI